jgi:hypothetical protein
MESRFFVEAKTFVFSVVDGKSDLWVEERRKGFSGAVCLGSLCIVWLISKMEWVLRNTGVEEFVDSFREGSKAVIVRRGGNKAGRFLEVAVYAEGGRKGMVLFPEGRAGRGWSRVSGELSKALAFFGSKVGSSSPVKGAVAGAAPSYAAVVSSVVPSSVLKRPVAVVANGLLGFAGSTAELDLFPLGSPEISPVLRSAVDCYDLECWVEPVGKNLCADARVRGRRFRGSQCSTARVAEVDVVHAGGGFHRKLLECLNQFKFEIDRAFGRVKEGRQVLGLGLQPTSGYKGSAPKPVKTRKFLMPKKLLLKPKPLSKPGCGSKPGLGRMDAVSSNPCLVAPVSTPEVVLVPVSTGSLPVCAEDDGGSSSQSAGVVEAGSSDVRQSGSSPERREFSPVRSVDAGDQFFSLPLDQNTPMVAGVGQSSPVRSVDAGDQSFFLPLDQNTPMDAGVGQSSPVRLVDADDQFLPPDQNMPLDQTSSPAVGLTAARVAESATLEADPVLGGCLYPLVSPEATEPTVKNGHFRYEGSVSLAGDGLSVRPCNPSAVVIAQKSSEPLYFYNRKHKIQRASKLDLGQLAGEFIRVAPAAAPLVGSRSSVSGEVSGLFAAFEPVGLAGSKKEGSFRAPTDGSSTVKPSAQSPPARGLLKRGFLRPHSCFPKTISEVGDSSEKSDLINGYSEAVVSSLEIAQALGISFGDNKKRFLDLMSEIEEGQHRVDGGSVLKPKGWRELKNLECSLNFDVGSIGSSRGKNKMCMRV